MKLLCTYRRKKVNHEKTFILSYVLLIQCTTIYFTKNKININIFEKLSSSIIILYS